MKLIANCGLTEYFKWMHPCYSDKNILLIHEFKDYCAILFNKRTLLNDSKNILVQADEVFIDSKEKLFSKAYLKGGIYKQTLQTDTEKLIIDSYKSRITAPELQTMLEDQIKKDKVVVEILFLNNEQDIILKNTANLLDIDEFETKRFLGNTKIDQSFLTCTIQVVN